MTNPHSPKEAVADKLAIPEAAVEAATERAKHLWSRAATSTGQEIIRAILVAALPHIPDRGYAEGVEAAANWHEARAIELRSYAEDDPALSDDYRDKFKAESQDHIRHAHAIRALATPAPADPGDPSWFSQVPAGCRIVDKPLTIGRMVEIVRANGCNVELSDAGSAAEKTASDNLGRWMSAALEDRMVCAEMKADIEAWFAAGQPALVPATSVPEPSEALLVDRARAIELQHHANKFCVVDTSTAEAEVNWPGDLISDHDTEWQAVQAFREAIIAVFASRTPPVHPAPVDETPAQEPVAWRCFHCDEVFTDEHCARLHFGADETRTPACQIKGSEHGLIEALREAENDAANAQHALLIESTDAAKAYYSQNSRHQRQMRAVEQTGYDRGIADAKAYPETLGLAPVDGRDKVLERKGIYIASKVAHATRWRLLRDKVGYPIISTWIDEAGEGQSADLSDLWRRCIAEASTAEVLVLNRDPNEVLKGGWVELGAALGAGVPVLAVGIEEFTVAHDKRIRHFATMAELMSFLKPMVNGLRFDALQTQREG